MVQKHPPAKTAVSSLLWAKAFAATDRARALAVMTAKRRARRGAGVLGAFVMSVGSFAHGSTDTGLVITNP